MGTQVYAGAPARNGEFWGCATRYASKAGQDESFVSEMAYMMVTLHRTGS